MNAYGMQSGGSGMPPVPQNIFATYSLFELCHEHRQATRAAALSITTVSWRAELEQVWVGRPREGVPRGDQAFTRRLPAGSAKIIARDDPQERLAGVDESSAACSHPSEQSDPPSTASTRTFCVRDALPSEGGKMDCQVQ